MACKEVGGAYKRMWEGPAEMWAGSVRKVGGACRVRGAALI